MNIVKDDNLALLTRVYGFRGSYYLCATAMLGFRLHTPDMLLAEDELWDSAAAALGENCQLDSGMPKPHAEALVAGCCHADGGKPVEATQAGFRVGPIEKNIAVFGDRFWLDEKSGQQTMPIPFIKMPIVWENAFGGPGAPCNPHGKGLSAVKLPDGRLAYPLPNIEYQNRLITFRNDAPPPASTGPQGLDWPCRMTNSGTFDSRWLAKAWPGLPDDFDFSMFNMAAADQQMKGYFKGGEEFFLNRLLPDNPRLSGHLPEAAARLFIMTKSNPGAGWQPANTFLDTVWLLPEANAGIMIWHGVWPVADDEANDAARLMAVLETCRSQQLSPSEHEQRLTAAEAEAETEPPHTADYPESQAAEAIGKAAAPPEASVNPAIGTAMAAAAATGAALYGAIPVDAAVEHLEQDIRAQFLSAGINPDNISQPPPTPTELEQIRVDKSLPPDEQMAELEQKLTEHLAKMGISADSVPMSAEQPPAPTVAETIAVIRSLPGDNSEMIKELEELEADRQKIQIENEALLKQVKQPNQTVYSDSEEPGENRTGDIPASGTDKNETENHDKIRERLDKGQGLAGMDLSRKDLRSYMLSGVDISSANLEQSNLSGMNLAGANLSNSTLLLTDLSGADLSGAVLNNVNAERCNLSKASLEGAQLRNARLSDSVMTSADLCEADATNADLSRADLRHAMFTGVNLSSANLEKTRMTAASADSGSNFSKAMFSGAEMEQAYFEQSDFSGAILSDCKMRGAMFIHCNMTQADLHNSSAHGAEFKRSNLHRANLSGINLMGGSLLKSDIDGADMRKANLYGADLRDCPVERAETAGANLKNTLIAAKGGTK